MAAGKTLYVDDFSVNGYAASGSLTSSIFDTIGGGANWGTLTYSASVPTNSTVTVKARTSNDSTMGTATAFSSCNPITSGTDISSNNCVTDTNRYIQYQVTLSTTDTLATTPTFQDVTIAFVPSDVSPPTGGSIAYIDGYYTTASVGITVSDGTDAGAGVDTTTRTLQRASATLSSGTCGTYSSFGTITPSGSYPNFTDTTVTSGHCYQYRYLVSDLLANQATYTTPNVVKMDTTLPATPGTPTTTSPTNNQTPTWTWTASSDGESGFSASPYTVQWSTDSSFGTNVTSASTGSTSYTIPSALSAGTWYFRVKATDVAGNDSSYSSTGTVIIDTTAPAAVDTMYPGEGDYLTTLRPVFRWKATTDGVALQKYKVVVSDASGNSVFTIDNIPASQTSDYDTTKYHVTYQNFGDNDPTNDYLTLYTKSSSDWGSGDHDGQLVEGALSWTVSAFDTSGNIIPSTRHFTVDITPPTLHDVSDTHIQVVNGADLMTSMKSAFSGSEHDNLFPYEVELTFTPANSFFGLLGKTQVQTFIINTDSTILNAPFALTPQVLDYGKYTVQVVAIDRAGNRSTPLTLHINFLTDSAAKILLAQLGSEDQNAALQQLKDNSTASLNALEQSAVTRRKEEAGNLNQFITTAQGVFLGLMNKATLQHLAQAITPVVQVAAPLTLIGLLPLASAVMIFSNLTNTSLSWNLIIRVLQAMGLLPRGKPNGILYDAETNAPIPFAVITVRNTTSELSPPSGKRSPGSDLYETLVSDVHGVYAGVGLPPGMYTLEVRHTDYRFPTQKPRPAYLQTKDFYKGEAFSVAKQNEAQFFLVPGDAVASSSAPQSTRHVRLRRTLALISHISQNAFIPSALLSFAIFAAQLNLWNGVMAGVYATVILFKLTHLLRHPTFTGLVKDQAGRPMKDVLVRLTNPENNQVVEVARTDEKGRYHFFSKKHIYRLSLEKNGYVNPIEKPGTFTEIDTRRKQNSSFTLAPATLAAANSASTPAPTY